MKIRLAKPQTGEEEVEAIREVLASGFLTGGPKTAEFERVFAELHETEHAVALANGTVALAAMLLAYDIGPGDEVIVPSMTFVSSATSVQHVGATPVFAEIRPDTFDLDPADVAARITPRTKAIMAVHYAGQPADLPALAKVATEHGVLLLEDAAQAHGARLHGRPTGAWGAAGMFSFTPTKNITTGEGGLVTTSDAAVADRIRLLRNHGMTAPYHHDVVGYNWRLTEMQAAMGVVQLGRLPGILERKRRNAGWLADRLAAVPGVTPPAVRDGAEHPYMIYTVLLDDGIDRDGVLADLLAEGIEAKVYFPPVHRQPIFAGLEVELPRTEAIAPRMLSLPFHAGLADDELELIADRLAVAVAKHSS
jgi:perosamine synthetase